jgi:predicted transcriptional regulator/DNA-binding XRE family transcriptional regulator
LVVNLLQDGCTMAGPIHYGVKVRRLRLAQGLTQAALAERLSISPAYLNLLENGRRRLTPDLLIRLARTFTIDLQDFGPEDDARLAADLEEVFGEPLFEQTPVERREIEALVVERPSVARAILQLHQGYTAARHSAESLAARAMDGSELASVDRVRLSSEQVSEFVQRRMNYFPELEAAAERLWRDARLERDGLFQGLSQHLEQRHQVQVRIVKVDQMQGAVRRYDSVRRELLLSEILRRGSRNFQLATQLGLLSCRELITGLADAPELTSDESRALGRLALASYFAAAVLMPYGDFLRNTEEVRYDVELVGHRFRVGWEQVCHRLTTLRRPGTEGVRFHLVRVDIAGNISKKFSATSVRFPRFSGLCPLWNVHAAFLQPGRIRIQLSRLPDGNALFSISRTVQRHAGDYHQPTVLFAVGIGCDVTEARRLVYADGVDLTNLAAAVPIGITCRLCERTNCQARAFPSLQFPLRIDEDVRGVSFFAPAGEA